MPGVTQRLWCITFSPKHDISDERVKKFWEWVKKHADMWRIITEEGPDVKKHLHAIVLFKHAREKRNLRRALETLWAMSQDEKKVFAAIRRKFGKVCEALHGAFDNTFYQDYLHKTGSCPKQKYCVSTEVEDTWDPELAEEHYVQPDKVVVNGKFKELYEHYNGERNLSAWADKLVADDIIDTTFVPVNGEKRFWRHFGLWVKAKEAGRHQEGVDLECSESLETEV